MLDLRRVSRLIAALASIAPAHAIAQGTTGPDRSGDVVVQGTRDHRSSWREAETSHVGDGAEKELARLARNVERLHLLLTGLLGRTDAPDQTAKLRITLIGDVPEFAAMDLRNTRWQQGPFNQAFTVSRYQDPRDTGAVMATTRVDQRIAITRTAATAERVLGVLRAQSLGTGNGSMAGQSPADVAALKVP